MNAHKQAGSHNQVTPDGILSMCASGKVMTSNFAAFGYLMIGVFNFSAISADGWDIEKTGQPHNEVEFTLSEGTWMSVDVSPDGRTLVFDLLGDLYTMPSGGGKANLLSGGAAIDRTPSFSRDGSKILYLSDRGGQDNVWMVNQDGSSPRQLTHETSHMVANPAWSADKRYIAASVIGTGFDNTYMSRLKLFHIEGGAGQTLVEIPPTKRDVQEPSFSSDGKYVYYTQRMVDTKIFVDANHANFAILRRNLDTGETEEVVKGFGGAISPQVSPDNTQLAFVRRVKDKTVLFVYDLLTGSQRPVFAELARDQQADFYQQGVYYPGFDWFPDGKHIAIWGKGKLLNVDVKTGEAENIPFEITSKHRIIATTRFADELAPDEIEVLTARNLALSPSGKELIFHALGHLWKKTLPEGQPTRLTRATAFEFEPAWSTDGRRITYVEWDDEKGSSLKVISRRGSTGKTVTRSRGVIRQPAFSPDGMMISYTIGEGIKGMGGYRAKPGLYSVLSSGGEPIYVGQPVIAPAYSADGSRLYFSQLISGNTTISSVTLDGYDQRNHARAIGADRYDLSISPDGRWLSFKEDQQYHVMPYRETGNLTIVSATSEAVPVATLTVSSGYNLTWSPDSTTLMWSLGKDIYQVKVAEVFQPDYKLPAPYTTVGLTVKSDHPKGVIALTGGQVITMRGNEHIDRGTVIVEGNRIVAVGTVDEVEIPFGAHVVDTTGKSVMPGFVDMHGHIDCCYYGGLMPQKHASHYAAAAYGVTTNLDQYTSEIPAYATTEMLKAGILVGPRYIASGKVVYGRRGKGDQTFVPLNTYADSQNTMLRKRALGGRVVKSYKQPSRRARQQLVKAGRESGIMIDAEGESQFYVNLSQIIDGHMALEHSLPVATYYDDIVQLMAHSGAANTPTLMVTFGEIMGENYLYQTTRAWDDPKIKAYVQETTSGYSPVGTPYAAPLHVRAMATLHAAEEIWDIGFRSVSRSVKKLDDAGVTINVGSHGQVFGLAFHWEMLSMEQGGMGNHQILRAATINGAKTLGLDDQIGSLELGKLADLIVLDKNPLESIGNSNSVRYTMINGRLYESLSMNEIGNYDHPRTKFYWELPDYNGIDWNEAWSGQ